MLSSQRGLLSAVSQRGLLASVVSLRLVRAVRYCDQPTVISLQGLVWSAYGWRVRASLVSLRGLVPSVKKG